jgi:Fic-DOC domain mobile mystery protein B
VSGLFEPGDDASTPLTPAEQRDLIAPGIAFRGELNAAERDNILRGQEWALRRRRDVLTEVFIRNLHKQMFGDVWRWAGEFRTSERNLGVPHYEIRAAIRQLLDDANGWVKFETYAADEFAVRVHHRLVLIHPFPNGNGRHARLMADLHVIRQGRERFSWGRGSLRDAGETRRRYVDALRAADKHDIAPLLTFARS